MVILEYIKLLRRQTFKLQGLYRKNFIVIPVVPFEDWMKIWKTRMLLDYSHEAKCGKQYTVNKCCLKLLSERDWEWNIRSLSMHQKRQRPWEPSVFKWLAADHINDKVRSIHEMLYWPGYCSFNICGYLFVFLCKQL